MTAFALAGIVAYLLGSIPFGLLITRAAGLGDVRKIGSGNIGATNVLRTGRRELAAATLLLDALKGTAAIYITNIVWPGDTVFVAAIAAFLGHCFPVWLRFKGGKGVATYIGVMLGLCWPVGVIFCAVWLVIALSQKVSSVSALTAACTAPLFAYAISLFGYPIDAIKFAGTAALLSTILFINHRANIARLIAGTEPKIGAEKKAPN